MAFVGVVGVGHGASPSAVFCRPLLRAGRARGQLPLVAEQAFEEIVAPFRGCRGPRDLGAAADRVPTFSAVEAARPAEALRLEAGGFGFGTYVGYRARAVRLAKGVASRDQRHGLDVVHRHARES